MFVDRGSLKYFPEHRNSTVSFFDLVLKARMQDVIFDSRDLGVY